MNIVDLSCEGWYSRFIGFRCSCLTQPRAGAKSRVLDGRGDPVSTII